MLDSCFAKYGQIASLYKTVLYVRVMLNNPKHTPFCLDSYHLPKATLQYPLTQYL
jgi:hypothetical protein